MSKKTVLLVDDEQHILNSLKRLLRKEDYQTYTALGAEKGLEILKDHPVQMVITDQRMPGMTGTEFLAKVREMYPDSIRVILSGYAEASGIVEAINQGGVYRFIAKPWSDEDLIVTIRQCLEHYDIKMENKRLQEQSTAQLAQLQVLNARLESSVVERTHILELSQEVLNHLPLAVLGISLEGEIMIANGTARQTLAPLTHLVPGTDMEDILPAEAIQAVQECLELATCPVAPFTWEQRQLVARPSRLGSEDAPRGCVLVLEEVGA